MNDPIVNELRKMTKEISEIKRYLGMLVVLSKRVSSELNSEPGFTNGDVTLYANDDLK